MNDNRSYFDPPIEKYQFTLHVGESQQLRHQIQTVPTPLQSSALVVKRPEGVSFEDPELDDYKNVRRSEAE